MTFTYTARIDIMPRPEILDPQGKATLRGLKNLGFEGMDEVKIGRRIELQVKAADKAAAEIIVKEACRKLLANTVTEVFSFEIGY